MVCITYASHSKFDSKNKKIYHVDFCSILVIVLPHNIYTDMRVYLYAL